MTAETLEGFRLSPQQSRLWSLQERDGAGAYRARCVVTIDGVVDSVRLRAALEKVVRRHEILRTTYRLLPSMGTPLQVVQERLPFLFEEENGGSSESPLAASKAIDLSKGPVLVAVLRRLSGGRSSLTLELPALCADCPTLERLLFELSVLYGGARGAEELGDVLQYADVAEWWNELLQKPESAPGIEYWRKKDLTALASLRLPFETAGGPDRTFEPRSLALPVSLKTLEQLDRLCRDLGSTLRVLLLTCWQLLLRRLLPDPHLVLGYATPGRRLKELAGVMGPCARTLPLEDVLEDGPTLRVALSRVAGVLSEQERGEDLFTWNAQPGASDGVPFFPFCFEYADHSPRRGKELSFQMEEDRAVTDRFAVRLACNRTEGSLRIDLDYDGNRLPEEEAERLAARFGRTLESALSNPAASVSELDIVPEEEKSRLLFEFNDTRRSFPDGRCIQERFEEAAARAPRDVAVVCEDRRLTYSDLNARANRIAHVLRSAGVGPDVLVALSVERSVEMIAGLLAIWKAGGAYLPLDPSLPDERLAFLLEDTGASHVLTRSALSDRFRHRARDLVLLDAEHSGPDTNPPSLSRPEHLAYVIFTSGSTGRPKGVAVEHRQISNYVNGILERLNPLGGASFATVTTLAADLGNTAIFPSLATGGCLYVVSEQRASDPEGLAEDFARNPVDYLKIVPSHLAALLSASRPERILPRRALVLGGEASSWNLIDHVRSLAPACQIFNHYGPTEATIGATTWEVPAILPDPPPRTVPIGRPLPNCRTFLLDSRAQTVPLGVAGELHIGGAGLARGYLNRPELTAEKFMEVDLAGTRERVYRTGDLARYLPDGNLELLGRTDDQVKLHGFRIEPGEVEAALLSHSAVREAVVLPRDFAGAGRRLVAYLVPRVNEAPTSADLRRFLLGKLPEFMVPSAFVRLQRFPRTPNGKIDRAALPLPDLTRPDDGEPLVSPRTREERILSKVWAEVLRVERFGVHDNFFELGGDSILAIQIIARASREGLRLTPRQLFERQTIAELAQVAEGSVRVEAEQGLVSGPTPLTPIQHWFFEQELLDPHHYNQSILLETHEALDPAALEEAVKSLLVHHDALRLRFARETGGWRQSNAASEDGRVFSAVPLGGLGETEQESAIEEAAAQAQASLNLSRGPMARALLFDLGPHRSARLLFIAHHLTVDGVSWRVLLEDLENAYRRIRAGEPAQLPPKTTSFRDWARRLTDLAGSGALEAEAAYWLSRTGGPSATLPVDSEGENTVGSARSVLSAFSEEETRALLQEVPSVYRSQINDALLAALAEAFARWTGSPSLLIDLEGHGREEIVSGIDLSRTVGWFTTRFPVLLELPESARSGESLIAVKEQLRAIPQRGIGYGILRYLGNGGGAPNRWKSVPEPAVSFNYLGQLDRLLPEDSVFRVLPSVGPPRSARDRRRHLIAVEGKVVGGRLRFAWIYSENLHRRATIERLAEGFEQALRALVFHCRSADAGSYTPSDFPKARLSQKDLEKLVAGMRTAGPGLPR